MMHMGKKMTLRAQDHLLDWYTSKPTYAVMGEYSAGKSTLLNLLLDQQALPTKVTATNLPPVWITYSDTPSCVGLRPDGSLEEVDLNNTGEDIREQYIVLRLGVTADRLKDADIIDTPGISDPKLAKGALSFLGEYVDFVLWLSAANQAWRQTEKMAWTSFPETLRDNSVLVLTRADKMRSAIDLAKVVKRCVTETDHLFREIIPLQTTKAAAVDHADRTDAEDGAWCVTGGATIEVALATSLEAATKNRKSRKPAPKKAAAKVAKKPAKKAPAKAASKPFPAAAFFQKECAKLDEKPNNGHVSDLINHVRDTIIKDKSLNDAHKTVLVDCLHVDDQEDLDLIRLIKQIGDDLNDFDKDTWIQLAVD